MTKPTNYCCLCGNEKTSATDRIGDACRALLAGPLAQQWAFYSEYVAQYSKCCGGMNTVKTGLYFHGKGWECSYDTLPNSVCVEMGVEFKAAGAQTYYLRDFGNDCDSREFGDLIPYPAKVDDPAFREAINDQLSLAAEHAWNADLLSCAHCGYHYYGPNGPCGCSESEEAEGAE